MRHIVPITIGLAVVVGAAACGGGPPPPPPGPSPDSLAALARADSIRRAEAQARADSIARARAERERLEAARRERAAAEAAARAETNRVREAVARRINFDFDRSNVRDADAATLDQKLGILRANPSLRIRVVGHCDERGSDEYNLALGTRRALAAKQYLVDRGIAEDRIETLSMGEEQALAMGNNEDAWAQNRRDEFIIVGSPGNLTMPSM